MRYRITGSVYRRAYYPLAAAVAIALIVSMIRSDPNGHTVTSLVEFSFLGAWLAVLGVRGWRSATLLVSEDKVTVRQLMWTTSWAWQQIEKFTVETQPVPWPWLPVFKVRRDVLGVQLRGGRVCWCYELSCPPRASTAGSGWILTSLHRLNELNELAQARRSETGV